MIGKTIFAILLFSVACNSFATTPTIFTDTTKVTEGKEAKTGTQFATIKNSNVKVRKGPGSDFAVNYLLPEKNIPIEIVHKTDRWIMIRTYNSEIGWVSVNAVSYETRNAIVNKEKVRIYHLPRYHSFPIGTVKRATQIRLISCNSEWCRVKLNSTTGWVLKDFLWGVGKNETF